MENPIKMDDLGVPLFLETPIYSDQGHKSRVLLQNILPVRKAELCTLATEGMLTELELDLKTSQLVNPLVLEPAWCCF